MPQVEKYEAPRLGQVVTLNVGFMERLRSNGQLADLDQITQMQRIVSKCLPIYLSCIINARPILRSAPAHECLPPVAVRFDRAVVTTTIYVP